MVIQHGQAGRSTRQMEANRGLRRLGILVLILVAGFGYFHFIPRISKLGGTASVLGFLALMLVFKAVMSGLETSGVKIKKEERRAGRGATAEEELGALFDALPDGYFVLNDVALDYGNIDHVILSRTKGLFVIEAKSHHGRVSAEGSTLLIDGHATEKDFIAQTLRNCLVLKQWIKERLQVDVWITGVVVFTNAFVELRQPVRGVHVINKGYLHRFLDRQPDNRSAALLWDRRGDLEALYGRQVRRSLS